LNLDLRIEKHPILAFKRGRKITFQFEGKPVEAYENENIAAALFASGVNLTSFKQASYYTRTNRSA
jgi:sarcosine oxidase subunit alpha